MDDKQIDNEKWNGKQPNEWTTDKQWSYRVGWMMRIYEHTKGMKHNEWCKLTMNGRWWYGEYECMNMNAISKNYISCAHSIYTQMKGVERMDWGGLEHTKISLHSEFN